MNLATQILSGFVAILILGCVTNATIMATGGYSTASALTLVALACGLACGALASTAAWRSQRRVLAILLMIALCAGEGYALLTTADRSLAWRDAQQGPMREAAKTRAEAQRTVQDNERAALGDTPRLQLSLEGKAAADRAVLEKSAEPGCRENLPLLLAQQGSAATAEVADARREAIALQLAAERRGAEARAALVAMATPASPAPLADRLGSRAEDRSARRRFGVGRY